MNMWRNLVFLGVIVCLFGSNVLAQEETTALQNALSTILCVVINLLIFIAGGIAMLIIILNGIKWIASGDDPGALKQARQGIVHAIVGLIVVLVSIFMVSTVVSAAGQGYHTISGC
ncbi:MAG: hypothetical protein ABH950_02815 [Candidatus Altiarchaeota archaeon]